MAVLPFTRPAGENRRRVTVDQRGTFDWVVGVKLPNGSYDPEWGTKRTLSGEEAWGAASALSSATGLPVEGAGCAAVDDGPEAA